MYHAHFGLERGLFGEGIAADAAVFRSPKHDRIIAHFKLALGSPSSCLVLRGPAGVGKTTLTVGRAASEQHAARARLAERHADQRRRAARAGSRRARRQHSRHDAHRAPAALAAISRRDARHRIALVRRRRAHRGSRLRGSARARPADGSRTPSAIPAPTSCCSAMPASTSISPRPCSSRCGNAFVCVPSSTPFTEAELQDYLRHQVACAGGHYDRVFAPGTVAALHRHSGGVARLANTLCATALELAASQQQKLLTAELVTKTAVSMLGLAETAPVARSASPAVSVAPAAPVRRRSSSKRPPSSRPRPLRPRACAQLLLLHELQPLRQPPAVAPTQLRCRSRLLRPRPLRRPRRRHRSRS